jgi:hypothetical protein
LTAFGGVAEFAIGGAVLLEDVSAAFVPVISMVGGIAALALANHERFKLRMDALEQRECGSDRRSDAIAKRNRQTNAV